MKLAERFFDGLRSKPWMRTLLIGVLLLAAVAVFLVWTHYSGYKKAEEKYASEIASLKKQLEDQIAVYTNASKEVDLSLVETKIQSIGELATIEYIYTNAGKFTDAKTLFGSNFVIPGTEKVFIAKWDGAIKAGVRVDGITTQVNEAAKTLTVCLPPAEILSHEIDSDSVETLDQRNGLFNPVSVDDVRAFDAVSKEAMEARAIENGILERADANARAILTDLICSIPNFQENYTLTFTTAD